MIFVDADLVPKEFFPMHRYSPSSLYVTVWTVSTGQPEYYPERGTDTILACSAKNATSVYWQRFYPSQRRVSINLAAYARRYILFTLTF
jgi:hypothetical protein